VLVIECGTPLYDSSEDATPLDVLLPSGVRSDYSEEDTLLEGPEAPAEEMPRIDGLAAETDLEDSRTSVDEHSAAGALGTVDAAETDYVNNSQPHCFSDTLLGLRHDRSNYVFPDIDAELDASGYDLFAPLELTEPEPLPFGDTGIPEDREIDLTPFTRPGDAPTEPTEPTEPETPEDTNDDGELGDGDEPQ